MKLSLDILILYLSESKQILLFSLSQHLPQNKFFLPQHLWEIANKYNRNTDTGLSSISHSFMYHSKNIIKCLLYKALNQARGSQGNNSNTCDTRARQQGYFSVGLQTPEFTLGDQCMNTVCHLIDMPSLDWYSFTVHLSHFIIYNNVFYLFIWNSSLFQ